jgi:hypothetical protein
MPMGRIRLRPSGTALARSVCTMPVWPACTVPGAAHGYTGPRRWQALDRALVRRGVQEGSGGAVLDRGR